MPPNIHRDHNMLCLESRKTQNMGVRADSGIDNRPWCCNLRPMHRDKLLNWTDLLPEIVRDTAGAAGDALEGSNPFTPDCEAHLHWNRSVRRFLYLNAAAVAARGVDLLAERKSRRPRLYPSESRGRLRRYFSADHKPHFDLLLGWLAAEGYVDLLDNCRPDTLWVAFVAPELPESDQVFRSMAATIDSEIFSEPDQPELEFTDTTNRQQKELPIG